MARRGERRRASQSRTGLSTELEWSSKVLGATQYSPVGVRNEIESSIAEAGTSSN